MKAAIYCRLSKEDEDKIGESESIQNQKSMLLQYAIEKGFDIYQIYSDEDYSGIDRKTCVKLRDGLAYEATTTIKQFLGNRFERVLEKKGLTGDAFNEASLDMICDDYRRTGHLRYRQVWCAH